MPDATIKLHAAEVLAALTEAAFDDGVPAELGERVRLDRRSAFTHLGLRTPTRRRRVNAGFSFTGGSDAEVLAAWDSVWWRADVADVLFAPLDHYRDMVLADPIAFWSTVSRWVERVDNWAHADDLARVYSRALEAAPESVYPTLLRWSSEHDQWLRRISMVSLIRYTGKNAGFMPANAVLAVVEACVADEREAVAKAVGWVLRETMMTNEVAVLEFLETHRAVMPASARRRAMERLRKS